MQTLFFKAIKSFVVTTIFDLEFQNLFQSVELFAKLNDRVRKSIIILITEIIAI